MSGDGFRPQSRSPPAQPNSLSQPCAPFPSKPAPPQPPSRLRPGMRPPPTAPSRIHPGTGPPSRFRIPIRLSSPPRSPFPAAPALPDGPPRPATPSLLPLCTKNALPTPNPHRKNGETMQVRTERPLRRSAPSREQAFCLRLGSHPNASTTQPPSQAFFRCGFGTATGSFLQRRRQCSFNALLARLPRTPTRLAPCAPSASTARHQARHGPSCGRFARSGARTPLTCHNEGRSAARRERASAGRGGCIPAKPTCAHALSAA